MPPLSKTTVPIKSKQVYSDIDLVLPQVASNYIIPRQCYLTKILLGFIILLILSIVLKLYLSHQVVVLNNGSRLVPVNCWFDESWLSPNHCAYFYPAPRVDNPGVKIRIPVVILKNSFLPFIKKNPVLYLSGGPGGSLYLKNQEGIAYWQQWMKINTPQHDLVLFEQRGTGMGQPNLRCQAETNELMELLLQQNLTVKQEMLKSKAAYAQCYRRLKSEGINLNEFTTPNNSKDVNDLMNALNYSHWNIYAVSYGTRLALHVLRDYPNKVRSVILDSVYPPEQDGLFNLPSTTFNALERLFIGCKKNPVCHKRLPNLRENFQNILTKLEKKPIVLQVKIAKNQEEIDLVITPSRFIDIIFNALYQWNLIELLPLIIHKVSLGEYPQMQGLVDEYISGLVDNSFSDGMHLSVECYDEDINNSGLDYQVEVSKYPMLQPYFKDIWHYNPCEVWDSGHSNIRERSPVHSTIPTLFLAGKYDPVTPAQWTHDTSKNFISAYTFQFNDIGHAVLDSNNCATILTKKFLQNPYTKPDDDCLDWGEEPNFELHQL